MKDRINRLALLGIPVDNVNMEEMLEGVIDMTEQFQSDQKNRLIATANVDFLVNAHKKKGANGKLLSILRNADMVTADGMPLIWLSKLIGSPLKERVTGSDMVPALAGSAAENGKSIYLLGGKKGSAKETAEILKRENLGLKIAGINAPMINLDDVQENKNIIARINISNPDILLIALGNPKQELWFERYCQYLRVPVSIGVGGTFEFISGITSRAPVWAQKSGLEWVYRITQDPKRLIKRYAVGLAEFCRMALPLIFVSLFKTAFSPKRQPVHRNFLPYYHGTEQNVVAAWKDASSEAGMKLVKSYLNNLQTLIIDFDQSKLFTVKDITQLLELFTEAVRLDVSLKTINIRLLQKVQLKLNRIYDLVSVTGKSAQPNSYPIITGKTSVIPRFR